MFAFTTVLAFVLSVLYAVRSADVWWRETFWAKVARAGVSGITISLVMALWAKASLGDPFLWFHYPILISLAVAVGGYLGVVVEERIPRHPRLARYTGC